VGICILALSVGQHVIVNLLTGGLHDLPPLGVRFGVAGIGVGLLHDLARLLVLIGGHPVGLALLTNLMGAGLLLFVEDLTVDLLVSSPNDLAPLLVALGVAGVLMSLPHDRSGLLLLLVAQTKVLGDLLQRRRPVQRPRHTLGRLLAARRLGQSPRRRQDHDPHNGHPPDYSYGRHGVTPSCCCVTVSNVGAADDLRWN